MSITTEIFPYSHAVDIIKRSRRKVIYLHAGMFAPFALQNPAASKEAGQTYSGLLALTRPQLLDFLGDAIPEHHRSKIALYISQSGRCMFVGSSPR